ncbi:PepSY domain-containing protein [Methylorubrum thiocyanatum]|jgi:uncharacterized iron-regulated membrane protein|uniref:PepSY domain-containing protein n=1 Tax=Methylorubrum thiocyanatum TaxID=47958 RepID=UPI00383B3394
MPWYVQGLFLSQPLHFGDYGGIPLKIVWALLDAATIIVLCSGIYLYLVRKRLLVSRANALPSGVRSALARPVK